MTNFGINNKKDLCKITIDKICGVWYNGNFGAGVRQRPGLFSHLEKKERARIIPPRHFVRLPNQDKSN